MLISAAYILELARGKYYYCHQKESDILNLDWHIYNTLDHCKGQVEVMHISTANILEMVKDMVNITISVKYKDAC